MNSQEAQQAQTIKRIGEMLNTPWGHDVGVWVANCEDLREIVDSQAQKIAASATVIEEMHAHTVTLNALYLQAEEDIAALNDMVEADHRVMAEQAKEIEKLKSNYSAMVQTNRQRG